MWNKIQVFLGYVEATITVALFVAIGLMFLMLLGGMWPLFTGAFFVFVTIGGLAQGNWLMSLGGLTLYIASWSAVSEYGLLIGISVWFIGFMMWFVAPFVTLPKLTPCHVRSS